MKWLNSFFKKQQVFLYALLIRCLNRQLFPSILQGAENEVLEIETILEQSKIQNIKYMGVAANEESFKVISDNSPALLHIATHGFFLQDEKEIRQTGFMQMMRNENRVILNPLLRSDLLFAGANRAWTNEGIIHDIEDEILTAEEISQLNLSNTKLCIVSLRNRIGRSTKQ